MYYVILYIEFGTVGQTKKYFEDVTFGFRNINWKKINK